MAAMFVSLLGLYRPALGQVLIGEEVNLDMRRMLDERSAIDINSFDIPHARRETVEVILLRQVLEQANLTPQPELRVNEVSYMRMVQMVAQGDILMLGSTVWGRTADRCQNCYKSAALIRRGEFEAGLYASVDQKELFDGRIQTMADLRTLTAVSNKTYEVDWSTLKSLSLKGVQHSVTWSNMPKIVAAGRADFMLMSFQHTPDLHYPHTVYDRNGLVDTMILAPIPNVKVYLDGTRNWLISKKHPQGKKVLALVNEAIKQWRQSGKLKRVLTEADFFSAKVKNWHFLNPKPAILTSDTAPADALSPSPTKHPNK